MLNRFNLDRIGISCRAVYQTAGENDVISAFEIKQLLCLAKRLVEYDLHRAVFLGKGRGNAPAHIKLAPSSLVGGHTDDINGRSESAYHSCGLTAF